ncbi:hypothetical protein SYNTR_1041 [Candidatus Syntrophocurvum alkaliphilum]|uniref:Membrane dipeptidase n=1 Tax=Candidatus Syntrophocurvum alkaliphilum TaxID=2293317 RepID=A0A6I6DIA8_9FIRM|nr:dipeptidase [Candidatus Syntrophocurvum alkaliphilum]QGT99634.1 hypothetical protein SYNTR_1041 [Candidatus Syntrophocurvum alkaliphilum]
MHIVDLHCDTISEIYNQGLSLYKNNLHFDLERAKRANIYLQFFALFSNPTNQESILRDIFKQVDKFYYEIDLNKQHIYHVLKYEDIIIANKNNKLSCILHLEGAEVIQNDIEILRILYRLGLRSLGLTWNNRNLLADGVGEGIGAAGISSFGKIIIRTLEELGIILDLAHISEPSFYQALELYNKPVMVTHANAASLCNLPRNLKDHQLKALADNGGVIGVNQVKFFIKESNPTINDMIDHIVYISELIGPDYIALGSDFDGADKMVINNVEQYSLIPELLQKRGFSLQEIQNIIRGNALRVIKQII